MLVATQLVLNSKPYSLYYGDEFVPSRTSFWLLSVLRLCFGAYSLELQFRRSLSRIIPSLVYSDQTLYSVSSDAYLWPLLQDDRQVEFLTLDLKIAHLWVKGDCMVIRLNYRLGVEKCWGSYRRLNRAPRHINYFFTFSRMQPQTELIRP